MNNSCSFSLYFLFCFCLCGYVYAWAIHYWTLKSTDILSEHLEGWLKHPRFNFHHYVSAGGEEVFSRQPGSNTRVGSRAEKANQWQKKKKKSYYFMTCTRSSDFQQRMSCARWLFTQPSPVSDSYQFGHWLPVAMATVSGCEMMSKNDCSRFASKALMQLLT